MSLHTVVSRVSLGLVLLLAAGCSPGGTLTPTPMPAATSATEFATAVCSSLSAMSRAIGNPDTAADSQLSAALDDAINQGDSAAVDQTAASMQAELDSGRRFAAAAAAWEPGAATAELVDQLIVAFKAFVEAKRAAAVQGLTAADALAQSALEQAGGITAWQSLLGGEANLPADATALLSDCRWWEAGAPTE